MGQLEGVETLEAYIDELGNEIKNVKKVSTYLKEVESQQVLIEEQLERVRETSKILDAIQSQFTDKINKFEAHLKKNQSKFDELSTSVSSSLTDTEYYLQEQTRVIRQDVGNINKELTGLTTKTNLLEEQTVSMSSVVSTVNSSVLDSQRQINQLEQKTLELKESIQKLNKDQKSSEKRVKKNSIFMTIIILIVMIVIKFI